MREVPLRVEYSLTPLGLSLNAALEPLGLWGREHIYRGAEEAGVGVDAGVGLDTGVGAGAGADCEAEPQVVAGLGRG